MAINWNDVHVSEAEYDGALRGSVNAYYEHAKADPAMSQEEAIRSTAEMAERYETAMDEFRAGAGTTAGTGTTTEAGTTADAGTTAEAGTTADAGTTAGAGTTNDGGIDDDGGIE